MSQISTPKNLIANLPVEDDEAQAERQQATDELVAANRATTPAAALDKRRTPRMTIAELNQLDIDELRDRVSKIADNDRTPIEKVIDLVDIPRNTVANIAFGKPTVGGVAGLIGGPAAAGAAFGALGGPAGAGIGAAVGAGLGVASGLVGLAGRALSSSEDRQKIQLESELGGTGAVGQPRISASDALRAMGVKNRVVAGVVGFAGDVAFDPLTYIGPPGWGVKLGASAAGKTIYMTGSKARSLRRAVKAIASDAEPLARDAHWGNYLKARGLSRGADEAVPDAVDRISRTVFGDHQTGVHGVIENVFRPLGGERTRLNGTLLDDFYAETIDAPALAARVALGQSMKGSGRSLRIGLSGDEVGSEVLHVPYTDWSVQVPALTSVARKNASNLAISRLRDLGAGSAMLKSAVASDHFRDSIRATDLAAEHGDLSQHIADFQNRHDYIDESRTIPASETPPPLPSTPTAIVSEPPSQASKDLVRNDNGDVLEVFHGTPDVPDTFNDSESGIFFTDDPNVANGYTRRRGVWLSTPSTGSAVVKANLRMSNPLIIDAAGKRNDNIPTPWHQWKPKVFGRLPKEVFTVEQAAARARAEGYDGLIVRNVIDTADPTERRKPSTVYAVFKSAQIERPGTPTPPPATSVDSIDSAYPFTPQESVIQGDLYDKGNQARLGAVPGPTPTPPTPSEQTQINLQSAIFRARERQKAIESELTDIVNRQQDRLKAFDPATTPINDPQDLLAMIHARDMAVANLEVARSDAHAIEMATRFPQLPQMEPADAIDQIGETLYHLKTTDPVSVEKLAELTQQRIKALQASADMLDAPLTSLLRSTDRPLVDMAKSFLQLDDDAVAASAFGSIANAMRTNWKASEDSRIVRSLRAADQWWRTTFNVRSGLVNRKISHEIARRANQYDTARIAREQMTDRVKNILADAGVDSAGHETLSDVMTYVHLRAHELADPDRARFYTWEYAKTGPAHAADGTLKNPSKLHQKIQTLIAKGVLVNPTLRASLDELASTMAPAYRDALLTGQEERILGAGITPYLGGNIYKDEVQRAINIQSANWKDSARKGFIAPRTSHQFRYLDPNTGEYRRFFLFDQSLVTDFKDPPKVRVPYRFDADGNPLPPLPPDPHAPPSAADQIREVYKHDPKLAESLIEARENAIRYNELAASDPSFAAANRGRPTDPVELNELAKEGRFDRLTGGIRNVTDFFETDMGTIVESYFADAQRVIAKRNLSKIVDSGLSVNPEDLIAIGNAPGRTVKLRNGVVAEIIPNAKSALGSKVVAVKVGDTTFRQLDPAFRTSFAGDLLKLSGSDIDGKLLHPLIADRLEDFQRTFDAKSFEQILSGIDRMNAWWKGLTLIHPSWTVFNVIGNTANALTGGALIEHLFDHRRLDDAYHIVRRSPLARPITENGIRYSPEEFLQLVTDLGIRKNNISAETAAQFAKMEKGFLSAPERVQRFLAPWFKANQAFDDIIRINAFRSFLAQGFSPEAAAQKTLQALFDFGDFTSIEKNLFKRLIPFYSWMRSNLGYQLHLLFQRPMYAAMAPKLQNAIEEAIAGDDAVPNQLRPAWLRDSLAAQIGSDPESRFGLLLGNGILPQTDIYNILAPLTGTAGALKFLKYFTSSLSPAIAAPLQLGAGTEFFSGKTIGSGPTFDTAPGTFLADQVRLLAEYGPNGRVQTAFQRSPTQGITRALVGGRIQAMDQERMESSREYELRQQETTLRSSIRRAERLNDHQASLNARAALLALYRKMDSLGFDTPAWSKQQLQTVQ